MESCFNISEVCACGELLADHNKFRGCKSPIPMGKDDHQGRKCETKYTAHFYCLQGCDFTSLAAMNFEDAWEEAQEEGRRRNREGYKIISVCVMEYQKARSGGIIVC